MANTEQNDSLNDELLSAYVDGELSGELLVQVEQRLRTDAAAQQLVEELRSLSTTLQSLPKEALGKDIRESVLQKTEHTRDSKQAETTSGTRRWAWAAMALAATLFLMFIQPDADHDDQPLAVADKNQPETSLPQLEFRAAEEQPEEMDELAVVADDNDVDAYAYSDRNATIVDKLETSAAGGSQPENSIREVHLVLADGRSEFDKLLANHSLVPVAAGRKDQSKGLQRGRAAPGAISAPLVEGADQAGESSAVEEVLVETSESQLIKLLLALQTSKDSYFGARYDRIEEKEIALGALLKQSREARLADSITVQEDLALGKKPLAAELTENKQQLPADAKLKSETRIRVLFVLHPAPSSAKPAAPAKKARTDNKVDDKKVDGKPG